jgi:hypothetical protein
VIVEVWVIEPSNPWGTRLECAAWSKSLSDRRFDVREEPYPYGRVWMKSNETVAGRVTRSAAGIGSAVLQSHPIVAEPMADICVSQYTCDRSRAAWTWSDGKRGVTMETWV